MGLNFVGFLQYSELIPIFPYHIWPRFWMVLYLPLIRPKMWFNSEFEEFDPKLRSAYFVFFFEISFFLTPLERILGRKCQYIYHIFIAYFYENFAPKAKNNEISDILSDYFDQIKYLIIPPLSSPPFPPKKQKMVLANGILIWHWILFVILFIIDECCTLPTTSTGLGGRKRKIPW